MPKPSIPWAILLLVILIEALDSAAQYCFKLTAEGLGHYSISSPAAVPGFVVAALTQPYLWLGMGLVLIYFLCWSVVLSKADLSLAMPLTSVSYVFVALASLYFLHEHISLVRWVGIGCILVGVAIVATTEQDEEGRPSP